MKTLSVEKSTKYQQVTYKQHIGLQFETDCSFEVVTCEHFFFYFIFLLWMAFNFKALKSLQFREQMTYQNKYFLQVNFYYSFHYL